jgi:hypothetical protein
MRSDITEAEFSIACGIWIKTRFSLLLNERNTRSRMAETFQRVAAICGNTVNPL